MYPLTIRPDQEEALRTASLKIDEMIKRFEKSYEVRDKQDVLAMCALQFATIAEKNNNKNNNSLNDKYNKLIELINLIDVNLKLH